MTLSFTATSTSKTHTVQNIQSYYNQYIEYSHSHEIPLVSIDAVVADFSTDFLDAAQREIDRIFHALRFSFTIISYLNSSELCRAQKLQDDLSMAARLDFSLVAVKLHFYNLSLIKSVEHRRYILNDTNRMNTDTRFNQIKFTISQISETLMNNCSCFFTDQNYFSTNNQSLIKLLRVQLSALEKGFRIIKTLNIQDVINDIQIHSLSDSNNLPMIEQDRERNINIDLNNQPQEEFCISMQDRIPTIDFPNISFATIREALQCFVHTFSLSKTSQPVTNIIFCERSRIQTMHQLDNVISFFANISSSLRFTTRQEDQLVYSNFYNRYGLRIGLIDNLVQSIIIIGSFSDSAIHFLTRSYIDLDSMHIDSSNLTQAEHHIYFISLQLKVLRELLTNCIVICKNLLDNKFKH